jgi:hypothetical protein
MDSQYKIASIIRMGISYLGTGLDDNSKKGIEDDIDTELTAEIEKLSMDELTQVEDYIVIALGYVSEIVTSLGCIIEKEKNDSVSNFLGHTLLDVKSSLSNDYKRLSSALKLYGQAISKLRTRKQELENNQEIVNNK